MSLKYKFQKFIVKFFGNLQVFKYPIFFVWGPTGYRIKGDDVREIITKIQPGDILLRRYDTYISGLLIPGYFTHAAIFTGDDKITHMVGKGIGQEDILTFCRCDGLCLIRCNNQERIDKAIEFAAEKLEQNIKYDFAFEFDDPEHMSCTELVDTAFDTSDDIRKSENIISPDDFLKLPEVDEEFEIIYRKGK